MAATPETLRTEIPRAMERQEEFIVPETLQDSGIKVVQKTFQSQTQDDSGQPLIKATPTQVTTVTIPNDQTALTNQSKGDVGSSVTWLAAFWLRIIKKAMFFGWKVVASSETPK
ncbi:MAG TPA: hypothetical protein VFI61_04405 [Patescibacteria group bacterium]|nr:hypothetical protein [Patescibacteria group bacterium]